MTFVGIVIFTVYTTSWHMYGRCRTDSTEGLCADYAPMAKQEDERKEYRYMGEFRSLDDCQLGSRKVIYAPKENERIADFVVLAANVYLK